MEGARIWKSQADWTPQVQEPPFIVKITEEKHSQQAFLAVQDSYCLISDFYEGKDGNGAAQ